MACHIRSISMPSRAHPTNIRVEEELNKLRTSVEASTSAPQMLSDALRGLGGLYGSVAELIQLPSNQSNIAQKKWLENELDGSVRLLDLCDAMKRSLANTKEHVQNLQLSLRRNDSEAVESKVNCFVSSQKIINKDLKKCFRSFKHTEKMQICKDEVSILRSLTEAREITVSVFELVSSFLALRMDKEKTSRWFFMSKALRKRRVANNNECAALEINIKDVLCKDIDDERVQIVQNQLQTVETTIQDVEDGLELLFKQLIQSRVALLNVLSL